MLIKFFKKESAFSYTRLFFVLISIMLCVGLCFAGYTYQRQSIVENNKRESENFFISHKPEILKFKEKRNVYQTAYGAITTTTTDKKQMKIVDTYLSPDASKGITITYHVPNEKDDEAYVIGYLVIGNSAYYNDSQITYLKNAKDKKLSDIVTQVGVGTVFSQSKADENFELSYYTSEETYVLKGDCKTEKIQEIRIEKTKQ